MLVSIQKICFFFLILRIECKQKWWCAIRRFRFVFFVVSINIFLMHREMAVIAIYEVKQEETLSKHHQRKQTKNKNFVRLRNAMWKSTIFRRFASADGWWTLDLSLPQKKKTTNETCGQCCCATAFLVCCSSHIDNLRSHFVFIFISTLFLETLLLHRESLNCFFFVTPTPKSFFEKRIELKNAVPATINLTELLCGKRTSASKTIMGTAKAFTRSSNDGKKA